MNYRKRHLEDKITHFSKQFPVVVLNGARQTGKSTLLDHLYGQTMKRIVFDPVIDIENARADPELFLQLNPPPVILDEIQYAPELLPVIKRRVDERRDKNGQYFLTGSQQFSVMKSISESLAGRAVLLNLWPLSLIEITEQLDQPSSLIDLINNQPLPKQIRSRINPSHLPSLFIRGGYPATLNMDEESAMVWFDSYLKTYVERDIRTLGDIGDLQTFTRFIKLCAQLTAQEINYSHLGREIGVDPKTAKTWLAMLMSSYQWVEIPAYSGNTIKRISEKPKGYFSDVGFAAYLSSITSSEALRSHPLFGHLFETYVVTEIIKRLQTLPTMPALYHWRSHGGAEVDLVIEKDNYYWLIEIKLTARPMLRDTRGFSAFRETYPKHQIAGQIIISGGETTFQLDKNTMVIPITLL